MKKHLIVLFFLFLTLTCSLKPKFEAEAHLRGKIGQPQTHETKKETEHNEVVQGNQHKQKQLNHEWNTPSSSSDFKHQKQEGHQKTTGQDNRDHQLFTPSTSSSYNEHKAKVGEEHRWGSSSSHRHEWGHTSRSSYRHDYQEQEVKQHKMTKEHRQQMASDTDSPTSSSDWADAHKQAGDNHVKEEKSNLQSHKKLHRLQKHEASATSSYTSSSDFNHYQEVHRKNNMMRNRQHQEELHDEFSQDNYEHDDDMNDYYDDDEDDNGFTQQSGHGTSQGRYPNQMHRQNDRDERNNGQRYYYVDENGIRTEKETSSDTSSVKQPDLRDYIDYNKPLDPDHPAVKRQTNRVTTDGRDTVGAAKGADLDDDTSVSSASTVSDSVKDLYNKKMSGGSTTTATSTGSTTTSSSVTPATTSPLTSTTTFTTYDPSTSSSTTTGYPYHQQTMTTTTTSPDGTQQQSTMTSGSQQHQAYKYQADANRNTEANHDTAQEQNRMEHLQQTTSTTTEAHLQTQPSLPQTIAHQASETQKNQHLQYGSEYTDDNDDDGLNDQNNSGSDDDNKNGDFHDKLQNFNSQQVV